MVDSNFSNDIAVIGCGWLGFSLAKQLLLSGLKVVGTSRNSDKLEQLKKAGIFPVEFALTKAINDVPEVLTQCGTWVVNIPPGRKGLNADEFVVEMRSLVAAAEQGMVKHLIFISTTSVFGDSQGNIDENAALAPQTQSGIAHAKLEVLLRSTMSDRSSILRLAGLVDEHRHPVNSLSGKKGLSAPNRPVNLVHKTDVCSAIQRIIEAGPQAQPMHLCSREHPTRAEYYQWAAKKLDIPAPEFIDDAMSGKVIECQNTLNRLGLSLQYESPYEMLAK